MINDLITFLRRLSTCCCKSSSCIPNTKRVLILELWDIFLGLEYLHAEKAWWIWVIDLHNNESESIKFYNNFEVPGWIIDLHILFFSHLFHLVLLAHTFAYSWPSICCHCLIYKALKMPLILFPIKRSSKSSTEHHNYYNYQTQPKT
jgi:hypothetical protein